MVTNLKFIKVMEPRKAILFLGIIMDLIKKKGIIKANVKFLKILVMHAFVFINVYLNGYFFAFYAFSR
jgi:hypothetical protein